MLLAIYWPAPIRFKRNKNSFSVNNAICFKSLISRPLLFPFFISSIFAFRPLTNKFRNKLVFLILGKIFRYALFNLYLFRSVLLLGLPCYFCFKIILRNRIRSKRCCRKRSEERRVN